MIRQIRQELRSYVLMGHVASYYPPPHKYRCQYFQDDVRSNFLAVAGEVEVFLIGTKCYNMVKILSPYTLGFACLRNLMPSKVRVNSFQTRNC